MPLIELYEPRPFVASRDQETVVSLPWTMCPQHCVLSSQHMHAEEKLALLFASSPLLPLNCLNSSLELKPY